MRGKEKCRILKEIRQRIADENEIPWVTSECRHRGECRGTCPRCESELRELERRLEARRAKGLRVTVAALCAGMAFTGAACTRAAVEPKTDDLSGMIAVTPEPSPSPEQWQIMGEIAYDGGELEGDVAVIGEGELMGEPLSADDEAEGLGDG